VRSGRPPLSGDSARQSLHAGVRTLARDQSRAGTHSGAWRARVSRCENTLGLFGAFPTCAIAACRRTRCASSPYLPSPICTSCGTHSRRPGRSVSRSREISENALPVTPPPSSAARNNTRPRSSPLPSRHTLPLATTNHSFFRASLRLLCSDVEIASKLPANYRHAIWLLRNTRARNNTSHIPATWPNTTVNTNAGKIGCIKSRAAPGVSVCIASRSSAAPGSAEGRGILTAG